MKTPHPAPKLHRFAGPARGLALAALALALPACSYSSKGKTYTPPMMGGGPPGSTTLLQDEFVTFPSSNWTTPVSTHGATASDEFTGVEYHALLSAPTRSASTAPSISTQTVMAFTSTSLTVAIDMLTTAQSSVADVGSVLILDKNNAGAVLARADLDASAMTISVSIGGGAATNTAIAANTFYRVVFQVNGSNQASWSVGGGAATSPVSLTATMVNVGLAGNWALGAPAMNPVFKYRNLLVTTP